MARVKCPFCHKFFDERDIEEHYEVHTKRKADGQLTDYITVDPEERFGGSLEGVPRWYRHKTCGAVTGMPEEIIRSYLVNPFLYSSDCTFCTGCHDHVPFRECVWTETGENLQSYTDRLRERAQRSGGKNKSSRRKKISIWDRIARALFGT
jgi:hypothetical protein